MPETRKSPVLPLAVAAIAALALVIALFGIPGDDDADESAATIHGTGQGEPSGDNPLAQLDRRDADDPMAMGEVDAPVVMVAYSEFQCPFCGKFARDTSPALEKYIENGTLRIEWRDFPYLGPESTTAALAGRAAAAQGKFWQFHDAMFADQLPPNSGKLDETYVENIADQLGLDVAKFRDDMASDRSQTLVDDDFQEGQQVGISGTPSFVINGTPLIGAQPTPVFEEAIDKAAAEAS